MYTYERDFRYLLLNLLPRHRLAPELRHDVDRALRGADIGVLRRQSVRALESLREADWLERNAIAREGDTVLATYQRHGGGYRVTVTVPAEEWRRSTGEQPGSKEATAPAGRRPERASPQARPKAWGGRMGAPAGNSPLPGADGSDEVVGGAVPPGGEPHRAPRPTVPVPPDAARSAAHAGRAAHVPPDGSSPLPPAGRPQEDAAYVPEMVRSFAVSDRSESLLQRVDTLLVTIELWFELSSAELDVVEDTPGAPTDSGSRVRRVEPDALREATLLRTAIETGAHRLVGKADAIDSHRISGGWDTMGVAAVFSLGKVQGILRLYYRPGLAEPVMASRLNAATALVRQVFELHNQVANLTSIDALTGVYNRRFFDSQLAVESERSMRSGTPVSLLLLDIDDFKRVNDELGHRKGDEALRVIADLIRRHLRKVDMPFRYGGEEFVILLPGTPELEAVHTAERLRRVIADHTEFRDLHGQPRRVTVSVGVSVFPDLARTPETFFEQADRAMYRAKALGKNRVVRFDEEPPPGNETM